MGIERLTEFGGEPYLQNRERLLTRVLDKHLRRRLALAIGGPYTDNVNGPDAYVYRIDDRWLAAERKIVHSLIGDLCQTGPDGARTAVTLVFDAMVAHAERRRTYQRQSDRLEPRRREFKS